MPAAKLWIAAFAIALAALPVQAQDEAVTNGVAYLRSVQNEDGSWGVEEATKLIDTVEAALDLTEDPNRLSQAVEFLKGLEPEGTDGVARKMLALAAADEEVTDLVEQLLGYQNEDGSWGAESSHQGTPIDTALAIRALATQGALEVEAASAAIDYLDVSRAAAGGWALQEGGADDLYVTSNVVLALGEISGSTGLVSDSLSRSLVAGSAFIEGKLNADNSYGIQDQVIQTSWAILALLESSQPDSIDDSVAYLKAAQLSNGSWGDDAHQTALAIRAIRAVNGRGEKPADLMVTGIAFDPASPDEGESVLVTVTVSNQGEMAAANVGLKIADGTRQVGPALAFPSIASDQAVQATITATFSQGTHTIQATADPENLILEQEEANNSLAVNLEVGTANSPDLVVTAGGISFSKLMPAAGEVFQTSVNVQNTGGKDAKSVTVSLYSGDPSAGGTRLGDDAILPNVPAGGAATASFSLSLPVGNHAIYAVADRADLVSETNETNNQASSAIEVLSSNGPLSDLAVTDLAVDNASPEAGEAVTLSARITNVGAPYTGPNVPVRFFDEAGVQLGSDYVLTSLEPGAAANVTLGASFGEGTHKILVVADPSNVLAEVQEGNNAALLYITVKSGTLADLVVESVNVSKASLDLGEPVILSATVRNTGVKDATGFVVRFLGETPVGGIQAGSDYSVAHLAAGQQALVQVGWIPPAGDHRIFALADATNRVAESNEGNNLAAGPAVTVSTIPYSNPQVFEEAGTDFIVVAPRLSSGYVLNYLILLADEPADYSITGPMSASGTVTPGNAVTVAIPNSATVAPLQSVVPNRAIHITATTPIRVHHVIKYKANSLDSSLVLPVSSLGTDHRAMGYGDPYFLGANYLTVLGTEDATDVQIEVVGTATPQTFNFTLNAGDAYKYAASVDISGTRVTSTKPVVCVSHAEAARVPGGISGGTDLIEQLMPARFFGKRFLAASQPAGGPVPLLRAVAHEDATQVTFKQAGRDPETVFLAGGENHVIIHEGFTEVESDKPIFLAQYQMKSSVFHSMFQIVPTAGATMGARAHGIKQEQYYMAYGAFISPFEETGILINGEQAPLANHFEYFRDDVKFSYDVWSSVNDFGALPTVEYEIGATRPILPYSVGVSVSGFLKGSHGHPLGYRFRTQEDLFPASIKLPSGGIFTDRQIDVRVRVYNLSFADTANVKVRLYEDGSPVGADQTIATLLREEETELVFPWTPRIPGARTLTLVVDPENEIIEADEENNSHAKAVDVHAAIDIEGNLALGGSTALLADQELAINTSVENISTSPTLGFLSGGQLEILVEDAEGNLVTTLGKVALPDLGPAPPGLEGWKFYVEAALVPAKSSQSPAIVAIPVDFTKLLQAGGVAGTFDENSLRVVEIAGDAFVERPAYLIPAAGYNATSGASCTVEIAIPGPLVQDVSRVFRIYFDAVESGPKPAQERLLEPTFASGDAPFRLPPHVIRPKGSYLLSDRKGGFTVKIIADETNQFDAYLRNIRASTVGDYNGDGFYDLLRGSGGGGHLFRGVVYTMETGGSNDLLVERPAIWSFIPSATQSVFRTADANGDGVSDLVMRQYIQPNLAGMTRPIYQIRVYLGRGDGTFMLHQDSPEARTASEDPDRYWGSEEFDLADADGDGLIDLIAEGWRVSNDDMLILFFKGQGDGTFDPIPIESAYPASSVPWTGSVKFTAGDFNSDGNVDLVFDKGYISAGNGDGTFPTPVLIPGASAKIGYLAGGFNKIYNFDFNRDGNLDTVAPSSSIDFSVALSDGAGDFTSSVLARVAHGIHPLSCFKAEQVTGTAEDLPRTTGKYLRDFTFSANGILPGDYRVRMNVYGGEGKLIYTSTGDFEILSPLEVGTPEEITEARVVTGKSTYPADETVAITSTVINVSTNATLEDLTLKVTVTSPEAVELFTDEKPVEQLLPGAAENFAANFPTEHYPPGTPYTVTFEVLQDTQVIAQDTAVFGIAPTYKFSGTVAANPAEILPGVVFALDFTLENLGNIDVTDATARFQIVQPTTGYVYATYTKPVTLAKGGSLTDVMPDLSSEGLPEGVHLVTYHLVDGTEEYPIATSTLAISSPPCDYLNYALFGDDEIRMITTSQTGPAGEGSVFSNSSVLLNNEVLVQGDAFSAGGTGTLDVASTATVTGETDSNAEPIPLPTIDPLVDSLIAGNMNDLIGLTAGGVSAFKNGDFELVAGDSIELPAGAYTCANFVVDGTLTTTGPVIFAITGNIQIKASAVLGEAGKVSELVLLSTGANTAEIKNDAQFFGLVFFPRGGINIRDDAQIQGALVGRTIFVESRAIVNYDAQVQEVCALFPENTNDVCSFLSLAASARETVELTATSRTLGATSETSGTVHGNHAITVRDQATVEGSARSAGGEGTVTVEAGATVTGFQEPYAQGLPFRAMDNHIESISQTNNNDQLGLTDQGDEPLTNGHFKIKAGDSITLAEGRYIFDTMDIKGSLNTSGRVIIALTGGGTFFTQAEVDGENAQLNSSQLAERLLIVSNSSKTFALKGGAKFYGAVYAPKALIDLNNDSEVHGTVAGKDVKLSGNARIYHEPSVESFCDVIQE